MNTSVQSFFWNLLALLLGLIILSIFIFFLSALYIVPVISVYAGAFLFLDRTNASKATLLFRKLSIILIAGIGILFYGLRLYLSIVYYPAFLNLYGIITEAINVLVFFISALFLFLDFGQMRKEYHLHTSHRNKKLVAVFCLLIAACIFSFYQNIQLSKQLEENNAAITELETQLKEKDAIVAELKTQLEEKDTSARIAPGPGILTPAELKERVEADKAKLKMMQNQSK